MLLERPYDTFVWGASGGSKIVGLNVIAAAKTADQLIGVDKAHVALGPKTTRIDGSGLQGASHLTVMESL